MVQTLLDQQSLACLGRRAVNACWKGSAPREAMAVQSKMSLRRYAAVALGAAGVGFVMPQATRCDLGCRLTRCLAL